MYVRDKSRHNYVTRTLASESRKKTVLEGIFTDVSC